MLTALVLSVFMTVSSTASIPALPLGVAAEPDGELPRGGFFGAKVIPVSDEVRERFKLEAGTGALIDEVIPGSTAEAAGFKAGDVLLALDGAKIAGPGALVQAIAGRKAGAEVTIELRRGDDLRQRKSDAQGAPVREERRL